MEQKKIATFLIGTVIVLIMVMIVWGSKNKKNLPSLDENTQATPPAATQSLSLSVPIFFYGNTCPHCADVEEWMRENQIEEKIEIVKKEVYDNHTNSLELTLAAKRCGIPTDSIGVPFLYTPEGKCLIGTPDIVSYLSNKVGLSATNEATESGKEAEL